MPKKTSSSGERRTKLFRSVSALGSRKHRENTAKETKDRRPSGAWESDEPTDPKKSHTQRYEKIESELSEVNARLSEVSTKLQQAELENENLKSLISANYSGKVELPDGSGQKSAHDEAKSVYPSTDRCNGILEASLQGSKVTHCKECEKLKETTIKAVVEATALRKYAKQLSTALSGDDQTKSNLLESLEKKLISAQTEKEIALEELAHVIEQRDQIVNERDRALEEWGKAATKWENTLDQVDSLMTELNKVLVTLCSR